MAFTFYSPPTLSAEQASPFGNLLKNSLQKNMLLNQAKYLPKLLQEELQKEQLANQYYPRLKEAELGKVPLQRALLEAQTQSALSLANKRKVVQDLMLNALGGKPFSTDMSALNNPTQNLTAALSQGRGMGMLSNPDLINNTSSPMLAQSPSSFAQTQNPSSASQALNGLNYPQAALLTKEIFGTQPKFIEVNGQHLAVTPFGNVPIAQGLTEEEKATQRGFGTYKSKLYGEAIESFRGYQNQGAALDEITDAVENNSQFRNVTGRINMPLTNWLGTPEQKELLGRLQSSSGEIALQVAPALKGAFTGRDQTLINSIKASPSDFPDVFIGKLKAQKLINNVLSERSKLTAQLLEKGYSPLKAAEQAAKMTPLSKFRPIIDKLTSHHRNSVFRSSFGENEATKKLSNAELFRIMGGQ